MTDLNTRLAKAKTQLVLEHPFVGTIALQKLKFHIAGKDWFEARGMPETAAVSSTEAYFCDEFMEEINDDELKFLVAHECMHPMLEHNWRRGERDPTTWNAAADYVINKLLTDEGIGSMPECGLFDEGIYAEGEGMSERIYANIYAKPDDSGGDRGGDGGGNQRMDTIIESTGTPAEKEQEAQEWKIAVAQAAQAAKIMGKMSAGLERLVAEILDPVVNWRDVLSRFLERCRNDARTFARPNRRFLSQGLYLPSVDGEVMGELAFAVDCSGSIKQKELDHYAAEIREVQETLKPRKLHVIYFDTEVCHVDTFGPDDEIQLNMHGGGGTRFSPVFRYMFDNDIDPVACVFLTDLYCSDFGEPPAYPVLWVTTGRDEAPFGEIVPFSS